MHIFAATVTLAVLKTGVSAVERLPTKPSAAAAPQGQAANHWRYQFYDGRWWYWKPNAEWSYFDGRRWVDWGLPPTRESSATRAREAEAQPLAKRNEWLYRRSPYPFNYRTATSAGNLLPSIGSVPLEPSARSGFGVDTIAGSGVGVGSETGSRSGDAGSGVGGGTVGGADVSGWYQPK